MNTSPESFTILVNPIDPQLMFIQHNDTGFYNLTKISETATYPSYRPKKNNCLYEFLQSDRANIIYIKTKNNIDLAYYELYSECVSEQFAGVFAHKDLYYNYLTWINPMYQLKRVDLFLAEHQYTDEQTQATMDRLRAIEDRYQYTMERPQATMDRYQATIVDEPESDIESESEVNESDIESDSDIDYESSDDGLPPVMIARGFIQRRSFDDPNDSEYDYDSDEDTDMDPTFESDDDSSDEEDAE